MSSNESKQVFRLNEMKINEVIERAQKMGRKLVMAFNIVLITCGLFTSIFLIENANCRVQLLERE